MAYGTRAAYEPIRELAFGSITASYQAVGNAISDHARIVRFVNTMDKAIYISLDGTTNEDIVPANGYVLYDFSTNRIRDDGLFLPLGTTFYAKQVAAPASGSLYIVVIHAQGGV